LKILEKSLNFFLELCGNLDYEFDDFNLFILQNYDVFMKLCTCSADEQ